MRKNHTDFFENICIILMVLLMLPFPKLIEEICIVGIFTICLIFIFSKGIKNNIRKIYANNIPYLIISIMLLEIHSVRFSLVAHGTQEQLIFVRFLQLITKEKSSLSEVLIFSALIYIWSLLFFLITFTDVEVKKLVVINEHFKYETLDLKKINILQAKELDYNTNLQDEITVTNLLKQDKYNDDFIFYISKIRKYMIACFVISISQLICGIAEDVIFQQKTFEISFIENSVITIGSILPFIAIYLLMIRFIFVYFRRNGND